MKKLIPALILCFVFCFMCFFYEPIIMYANNIYDFWFDLGIMIIPVIKIFAIFLLITYLIYIIIYYINKKFFKDLKVYNIFVLIGFIVFLATYIQGNYLIGNLPILDGSTIVWSNYKVQDIVTIIIWLVIITIVVILSRKKSMEKTIKYATYLTIAIFVMLLASFTSTLFSTNALINKKGVIFTDKNINLISKNKNFIIFMLDAVDSQTFYKLLQENTEYQEMFNDFTYYPDTLSMYPFTIYSVPYILSGKLNKNEKDFIEYSSEALNTSSLLKNLTNNNYEINLFDNDLTWDGKKNFKVNNMIDGQNAKISLFPFMKQELKYILFKYVPYGLKKYSRIEGMDFNYCTEKYLWMIDYNYKNILENVQLEKTNQNQFQFVHLEGAHVPFKFDKDLNLIKNGTYEQKVEANITLINAFLKRLKANKSYDNTVVVIMSDHGYSASGNHIGRFNSLLLIKGFNENHEFKISDKPISHYDLQTNFLELIDSKKSSDLFSDIKNGRTRIFLDHELNEENHLVEYKTKGPAWDIQQYEKTGKVYDR